MSALVENNEEKEALLNLLRAKIRYYDCMFPKVLIELKEKFPNGYSYNDLYKFYGDVFYEQQTPKETEEDDVTDELNSLRRKLSMLVHPDKYDGKDANILFDFIQNLKDIELMKKLLKENTIEAIRKAFNGGNISSQSIEQSIDVLNKKISEIENQVWWLWKFNPLYYGNCFMHTEEYEKRKNEILAERKKKEDIKMQFVQDIASKTGSVYVEDVSGQHVGFAFQMPEKYLTMTYEQLCFARTEILHDIIANNQKMVKNIEEKMILEIEKEKLKKFEKFVNDSIIKSLDERENERKKKK